MTVNPSTGRLTEIITLKEKSRFSVVKVAPYSFMTTRALMMRAVVICARSHKIVGFS